MYRSTLIAAGLGASLVLSACGGGDDESTFDSGRACQLGRRLATAVLAGDAGEVGREVANLEELPGVQESDLDVDAIESLTDDELDEAAATDVAHEFTAVDDCEIDVDDLATPSVPPSTATTVSWTYTRSYGNTTKIAEAVRAQVGNVTERSDGSDPGDSGR